MASISTNPSNGAGFYSAKVICQIVGLVCLSGFVIDMVVLALPPNPASPEWRSAFMQQLADRSIIMLLGAALTIFSLDSRRWLKRFSTVSLVVGVIFLLSTLLVIRDSLTLQQQAISNISSQASQIQTRITDAQSKPASELKVTPEQLQQASQQLNAQANNLKQTAKTTFLKTGVASVGNLAVVGLGLISLGRYGMRLRKSKGN
ncbi:HpsJ family protein [Kovacikia minuta CCNUW1]|uniref:HpsJ-like protein, cyanoexosortase C-associated n=1 Tax=Kovacikia minuta TaxID=2931930 RepID=UPI001CCC6E56|nr:HpsJ family protein [Kovacikia minuta]UBF27351.1 HpsJ family protein [Kovacikia minuta CCNUW1]